VDQIKWGSTTFILQISVPHPWTINPMLITPTTMHMQQSTQTSKQLAKSRWWAVLACQCRRCSNQWLINRCKLWAREQWEWCPCLWETSQCKCQWAGSPCLWAGSQCLWAVSQCRWWAACQCRVNPWCKVNSSWVANKWWVKHTLSNSSSINNTKANSTDNSNSFDPK